MDQRNPMLARLIDQVLLAGARHAALDIRGGGTKAFYGEPAVGEPLDVTSLAGISCYEPTELVVTARAGTPLRDLSGPARASVGSVRDHVLGVTVLNGRGEVLTFGGQVAKNVAGYDVSRLMAGSWGILGVICEVSIKVMPRARAAATLRFDRDECQALEQFKLWASQPLPVNASVWHEGRLHVRLAGAIAAVDAACGKLGGTVLAADAARNWWSSVRDQTLGFFSLNEEDLAGGERLWRMSVPRSAAPIELPGEQFIEWHGAQRWWRTAAAAGQVRGAAARAGGHATLIRGADRSDGVFTPLSEVLLRVHQGLKRAFDPAGVFNPGRMYAEL